MEKRQGGDIACASRLSSFCRGEVRASGCTNTRAIKGAGTIRSTDGANGGGGGQDREIGVGGGTRVGM